MSRISAGVLGLVALFLALPYATVIVNSFATDWRGLALPGGFNVEAIAALLDDPRFWAALGRSVGVALASLLLSSLLIVPAVVAAHLYWPGLDLWLARMVVLPYAVPGVVLVVGYLRVFSQSPLALNGTPGLLSLVYVPLCFPLFYVSLKNALQSLPLQEYLDAGRLVGARDEVIFLRVILPMIWPSILLALILNFGLLLSEFVYANMLVGGRFETLQIFMFAKRTAPGRTTSAIVLSYFLLLAILTGLSLRLSRPRPYAEREFHE